MNLILTTDDTVSGSYTANLHRPFL